MRTNYWQAGKDWISIKIDSRAIDELPAPRPLVEIFVYSPRMEGIHLRGGRVARGGIRWSDRREDFRTEILGLMKTQMVKNAVIVPVGSKGGFYVKRPPVGGTREQVQAEGIACYQTLIRGLLDITDNYAGDGIRPPADVVRHDPDDPYLVVAADKGTATFSDIANALAQEYGFWLDDAFASGGSAGYDHKKMGITARGAWESVKRHFRELGQDIQTTPFTVTGVGDMSGDVFGNGMLLSRHIKLVAAFDHRHIFIDPAPNPATSWDERKRLFDLPRSSWMDYDKSLLSAGGGIYDRAAKSIALSAEARAVLGIEAPTMTPIDLMRAILAAPVDLLYFGGIGTYVKASSESHADAGDRASDALRINGDQVRARVVGEGANLGFTQRGRVEAALAGRKINTDALDNSAGVDTSDHEVNIKIVTGEAINRGALKREDRNALLFSMTDEVASLVLRHNYQQSQAISVAEEQAGEEHDRLERFMRALERNGRLDRAVEFLPDSPRHAHARPEPAVPDAARAVHAAVLRQDRSQRRDPRLRPARRPAARRRALALLPDGAQREARAVDPRPSPAPRDHGTAGRELAGQSLRADLRAQHGGPHRRAGGRHRPRLRRGARRLEAARPVGRHRSPRSRAQGRGADPHAGGLAALPDAHRAVGPAPPAAADRRHGRDRAARRSGGSAGRPAGGADRRGRECRPCRARGGLRGDGRTDGRRAPRRGARNPGGGGRSHAGGTRQRREHRGGGPALFPAGRAALAGPAGDCGPEAAARGPVAGAGGAGGAGRACRPCMPIFWRRR